MGARDVRKNIQPGVIKCRSPCFGDRIVEVLKQKRSAPVEVACQVAIVYAVINGYLNEVEPKDVSAWEEKLFDYLHTRYPELLDRIEQGSWEDSDVEEMKKALSGFRG